MRKVEFIYVEVLNETEQVMIFQTTFNGQPYVVPVVLNTALPILLQDFILINAIASLANMTRKDANDSAAADACQCKSCKGTK